MVISYYIKIGVVTQTTATEFPPLTCPLPIDYRITKNEKEVTIEFYKTGLKETAQRKNKNNYTAQLL